MPSTKPLRLRLNVAFEDLYTVDGIQRIDELFFSFLEDADSALAQALSQARQNPPSKKEESRLVIEGAKYVERFIEFLFDIEEENKALIDAHNRWERLYRCKRVFVQRRAGKRGGIDVDGIDIEEVKTTLEEVLGAEFSEQDFADAVMEWHEDEEGYARQLEAALSYARWALYTPQGQSRHADGLLFRLARRVDPMNLIPVEETPQGALRLPVSLCRERDGFSLTDNGATLSQALDHSHYCIKCHPQGKDSCSIGLRDSKSQTFRQGLHSALAGCPLEQKISEMHTLHAAGRSLAALTVVMIDNPLCAGTGHRICTNCIRSCIFQKQTAVDTPQVETRILKNVLSLEWGFEIYSLLTRWNPLRFAAPVIEKPSGYKVLVVGQGPAGIAVAYYLMNQGHRVAAIDGLKIEPLDPEISGILPTGERTTFRPIHRIDHLYESLDRRVIGGFGGVAEYGITARWDKNFLKILRLILERRSLFTLIGGVRFGGALTIEQAFTLGFDHIALCLGAGKPTVIPLENGLAPGVRQASDFLMALQLTGAAHSESLANLEIRLPIVVIGGGLTAIDTATEAQAYYLTQIEKFCHRYEGLSARSDEATVRAEWTAEEARNADRFLSHARQAREERRLAEEEGRPPCLSRLLESWGGCTIVYRRSLRESPSYGLSHEEVYKALEEGVRFIEEAWPLGIVTDDSGHAAAVRIRQRGVERVLAAGSVLIAAGTRPNTILTYDHLDRPWKFYHSYFHPCDEDGHPVSPETSPKPTEPRVLLAVEEDGRGLSYFGDLHPSFSGSVVQAIASAKQGCPIVSRFLGRRPPTAISAADLIDRLNHALRATVHQVIRLTPTIVEVVVKSPFAAAQFQPGQFYRLQNFQAYAGRNHDTSLAFEGLALTGAWNDPLQGLISTIILEMGGSSSLCAQLKEGDPIVFMGPSGTPTEIVHGQTVALIGGGLGNAVLFSIGKALKEKGCRVLYFAGYKRVSDRYKVEQIEAIADCVVWCCDQAPGFPSPRPQDKNFVGTIVQALESYAQKRLDPVAIPFAAIDYLIVIGSNRMMEAVAHARQTSLKPYLKLSHRAIGSINSPMQCMMKAICGQCLQLHKNPQTGEESFVFSCFNQDQPLDWVDFKVLDDRLRQNSLQEKLTHRWIAHLLNPC